MNFNSGSRLGPYEIVAPIGEGGMGEVYRGRDTRLDRPVAIKVLPSRLSSNPDLRQRFEREARTISAFNHPHICTLHDIGNVDGTDFLVMEFCDGETLAQRLARGPLPMEQVLRYGVQIADALDKAHRQGIIHRDLKPGNIMITKAGAKLLDFGLAKYRQVEDPAVALSALPTNQQPLTAEGTILGTFQYMAPEQLEGREADARTDIFAFGAVLYEMATGRRAFDGRSKASLIASIIERDPPPISSIQPMTPPAFERVVKTCLAKDPDDRWQTAHDVMLQLKWIAEGGSLAGVAAPVIIRRKNRERLAWTLVAVATLGAIALAMLSWQSASAPVRRIETAIPPPADSKFQFDIAPMALSPDGTRIAFSAIAADGKRWLYVRPLNSSAAQPIAEGGNFPFWSPDGKYIGYGWGAKLRKVAVTGGPPQTLCDVGGFRGGSWNRDGVIIFAPTPRGAIYKVASAGGTPVAITKLDQRRDEFSHRFPVFLPDGKTFLFLVQAGVSATTGESNTIVAASLDSERRSELLRANSNFAYAPPGYLLFWRDKTLIAQRFNARKLQLQGDPFPLAEEVQYSPSEAAAAFSVSTNGALAYQIGAGLGLSKLTWFDRSGKQLEELEPAADYLNPRLSHDGRRVCVSITDRASGRADLWIHDLARRVMTRFTFDAADDLSPIWSPDDRHIVFRSNRGKGNGDLYTKPTTGAGAEELLLADEDTKSPSHWSSDGQWILFSSLPPSRTFDIKKYSVAERKSSVVLSTEFSESSAKLSPDGKWMVYQSAESGDQRVYLQAFPDARSKEQVSAGTGFSPSWSADGSEIFYVSQRPDSYLMSVKVSTSPNVELAAPTQLFKLSTKQVPEWAYHASADGKRFLVNTLSSPDAANPITLVQNWTAELDDRR